MSVTSISITLAAIAGVTLALAGCATPAADAPLIPAKVLSCPKPQYPRSSLRNEETGVTTLVFTVGTDGLVHDAKIQRSSGYRDLDRAALLLQDCRFAPATRGGKPVESTQPMQFVWRLTPPASPKPAPAPAY